MPWWQPNLPDPPCFATIISEHRAEPITKMSHMGDFYILFLFYFIIIAYCLLRQSPMSDITYIALIMNISDYHSNQPPHILCNLSQEAAAVRLGVFEMVAW